MRITRVGVTYGELRSSGYPNFSNKKYEIVLIAALEEGETAREVKEKLTAQLQKEVKKFFGDDIKDDELNEPYQKP